MQSTNNAQQLHRIQELIVSSHHIVIAQFRDGGTIFGKDEHSNLVQQKGNLAKLVQLSSEQVKGWHNYLIENGWKAEDFGINATRYMRQKLTKDNTTEINKMISSNTREVESKNLPKKPPFDFLKDTIASISGMPGDSQYGWRTLCEDGYDIWKSVDNRMVVNVSLGNYAGELLVYFTYYDANFIHHDEFTVRYETRKNRLYEKPLLEVMERWYDTVIQKIYKNPPQNIA